MTPLPAPSLLDRLRAHAHLHPESAELLRDAAGCHAVTSDEGTSYCPLAEANAAAVARDAKVAEIVAEWLGSDNAPWPMTRALEHTIAIAALYGATR